MVSEGDEIDIPRMEGKVGDTVTIEDVLLKSEKSKAEVGTPTLDYTVTAEIVSQYKDKKVDVYKFKAKSRYRRKFGHRQPMTKLKITKITKKRKPAAKTADTASRAKKAPAKKS